MNSRPRENGNEAAPKIRLDLTRHCVETACRRRYNRAVGAYFADPQQGERLAQEIELLRCALEKIDFGALRRDHKALCGKYSEEVLLGQAGGRLTLWIDGQPVDTPYGSPRVADAPESTTGRK